MTKWLLILTSLWAVTACGPGSGARALSNAVLAERYGQCLDRRPTAPGKAQACENLRRECESRQKDSGNYICRTY